MPASLRLALALALAACLTAGAGLAQAPRPPAPQAATDPAYEAARTAFEALPEAERRAIQDALVWTGDFNAVVSGAFGRRTFEAMGAARARGLDPLDPRGRAALLAAGEAARHAARFAVRPDPATGTVIGVPERLFARRSAVPGGTRWQSADGRATLEVRAVPPDGPDLDALFERAAAASPERKVTYKLRRPDFAVVTAETAQGRSYLRYAAGPAGVRGLTVAYDKAMAGEVDRLVIAIANSFVPFPAAPAPSAAATPGSRIPGASQTDPGQADGGQAGVNQVGVGVAGTGLVVAAGRALTAAAVAGSCPAMRVGAAPARLASSDAARGLALIEAASLPAPRLPPVGGADLDDGRVVVAAGADGVLIAPGTGDAGSEGAAVTAPLQPGAAGAPVLDRSGRLAGIVARPPAAGTAVAGVLPPARAALVPARVAAAYLAENGITLPAAAGIGEAGVGTAAGTLAPAVVAITCAR